MLPSKDTNSIRISYDELDTGCIEDKVEISDDYVQDGKSGAKTCPLIWLDDDMINNAEFWNKELAIHLGIAFAQRQ